MACRSLTRVLRNVRLTQTTPCSSILRLNGPAITSALSCQVQARGFSSATLGTTETNLISKLSTEIEIEEESPAITDEVSSALAYFEKKGFKIIEQGAVTMLEKTHENEEITITFTCEDQVVADDGEDDMDYDDGEEDDLDEDDEQDGDDEYGERLRAIIDIKKDDDLLTFACSFSPSLSTGFDIEKLYTESDDEKDYTGPKFFNLDEDLQRGFYSYLKKRGINKKLFNHVTTYHDFKEQKEYLKWMKSVRDFVKQWPYEKCNIFPCPISQ